MKADFGTILFLAAHFAFLSLFAIGGANAAIPEMHRLAVEVMGWMTDREFADMFAIAQLAPGPNVILVTLIGYHVAGVAGAFVTTAAMCGPTCVVAYFVGRAWERFKHAPWRAVIQAGIVPVSIGLIGASAYLIARATDHNLITAAITAVTAALAYWTRINPLWMFAAAAVLGFAGLV